MRPSQTPNALSAFSKPSPNSSVPTTQRGYHGRKGVLFTRGTLSAVLYDGAGSALTLGNHMLRTPLLALTLAACAAAPSSAQSVQNIYWHDGDSGRIDGVDFRLADVDAPETGGVGSVNGAKCEAERVQGFKAKEWVLNATKGKALTVTSRDPARDQWDRKVLKLSVDGKDLGDLAVAAGFLKPYVFENGRQTQKKPTWC